ncbi:response regulator [Candidatus Bipolaricaulota bacterium]|jgi:CheY-like chemotaxis protein|nr:response regulator [Candidatus Bipolaricaulota bacterium]TFH11539.1 MAG: response regulator [Candidatus Atribacteria bacterium]
MENQNEVSILIVEDDDGHARLIAKNLKRAGISNRITRVENGRVALDFLFSEGDFVGQERPSPLLVLLDLNMPVLDGYQVLERMKADPRTHKVPVVILTTTDDAREVTRCYELGCSVYITKPVEYESFAAAIQQLGLFMSIVTVPNGG